jgi:imidazolonepropionase-like amidohydrolase
MTARAILFWLAAAGAWASTSLPGLPAQPVADTPILGLKAGRIHTAAGPVIENGVILVRDGKILAVDAAARVGLPVNTRIVADLPHAVVTPGLIDADASIGVERPDRNDDGAEILPGFRVALALDTRDVRFQRHLRAGITTVFVGPGLRGVIGGLGAVVKTTGGSLGETLVRDDAGLRITLGSEAKSGNRPSKGAPTTNLMSRRPTTRMGVVWLLRDTFFRYRSRARGETDAMGDADFEILKRVSRGEIPLRVHARRATDIHTALRLVTEFDDLDLRLVLDEATEGSAAVDVLARNEVPVVLGPFYAEPRTRYERREGYLSTIDNAAVLARAGIPLAFRTAGEADPSRLRTDAGLLIAAGLDRSEALEALTLHAARILGVADRVGSLVPGKDADLVVFDGDPFSPKTRILAVMVNGSLRYQVPANENMNPKATDGKKSE